MLNIAIMWHLVRSIKESIKNFFIQLNYCAINLRLHQIKEYIVTFVQYFRSHQDFLIRQSPFFFGVKIV